MLARTPKSLVYLSADELGITPAERSGLIEVRDDLASGRVKHVPVGHAAYGDDTYWIYSDTLDAFNMDVWAGVSGCGTAHCIGGFMDAKGVWPRSLIRPFHFSESLNPLFAPACTRRWEDLPLSAAVKAIDLFLSGAGRECWPLALADEPA